MEGWRNGRRMEGWRNGGMERGRAEGKEEQVWVFCHPPSPIFNTESEDLSGQSDLRMDSVPL